MIVLFIRVTFVKAIFRPMDYTDDTILDFGEYKGVRLCRVPAEYLYGFFRQNRFPNPEIKKYIIANIWLIRKKVNGSIPSLPVIYEEIAEEQPTKKEKEDADKRPCVKYTYGSEAIANEVLRKIKRAKHTYNAPRPIRSYLCKHCGAWHLTSAPFQPIKELR